MDSKDYRMSLKFSEIDPEQVEVAALLKKMGRKKSFFITKAVKYYLENNPNPELPKNNGLITEILAENYIKDIIIKMVQSGELTGGTEVINNRSLQKQTESLSSSHSYEEKVSFDEERTTKESQSNSVLTEEDYIEDNSEMVESTEPSKESFLTEGLGEMLSMLDGF